MTAPTVIVLRERQALAAIVPAWEDLAANALEANPFYEPWILLPALQAQGEGEDFRCISIWDEGRLIGLFPFERSRRFKGLPVTTLTSWRHSAYLLCTPLVRADAAAECLRTLVQWAVSEASVLEMLYVPASGPFDDALQTVRTIVRTARFSRALLVKAANAEAYIEAAMSSQLRRQLRRNERKLRDRGMQTIAIGPGDDIGREIETFLELEASGWKGREGGALAASEANLRFGRDVLSEAHKRGRLHMVGMDCDGRPIARRCSLLAGEGSYAFKTAYDESYAAHSPGVLAEALSLREFHGLQGVQWMDSYTEPGNTTVNRMWKDRRPMQSVAIAAGAWGAFWLSIYASLRGKARTAEPVRPAA
jgi:CelD/BcsL family acetyltransferase involved in cellulose biosynthesis